MVQLLRSEIGTPNLPMTLTVRSEILEEERRIYLHLPDDYYHSDRSYPLLLTLDGEWLFDVARANARFYGQFQAIGCAIPEMIVVGIENLDRDPNYVPTVDPNVDKPMFPTAGEADQFLRFLRDELLPLLERDYRVSTSRTIAGWSFGGLCALHSAVAMPELFDTYLCISPAIWWDDDLVVKQFDGLAFDPPKRVVITLGTEEEGGWVYTSTKRLLSNLDEKPIEGLDVTYLEFEGEGHSWSIPDALNKGLRALFPNYDIEVDEETTLADIEKHYSALSESWGFDVVPPSSVLMSLALKYREAENLEEGIRVLDWYLERNLNKSLIHAYKGIFLKGLGRREPALAALQQALKVELRNPVPDGVYVRGYHERIAEVKAMPSE